MNKKENYLFSIFRNCFFFIRLIFLVSVIFWTISAFLMFSSVLSFCSSALLRLAASLNSDSKFLIDFFSALSFILLAHDLWKGLSTIISDFLWFSRFQIRPDLGFPFTVLDF